MRRSPLRRTLLALYRGPDPYRWKSIDDIAKIYRTSPRVVKAWLASHEIPIRTSKENFERIKACMRRGNDPRHFSNLERLARRILEAHGLRQGEHWRHNFKVGTASIDFYFPKKRFALEIDSRWHDADVGWWSRGEVCRRCEADARRDTKLSMMGVTVARVRWYKEKDAETVILHALQGMT